MNEAMNSDYDMLLPPASDDFYLYDLDLFAEKYGDHGYLFDAGLNQYLEIKLLDFKQSKFDPSSDQCPVENDDMPGYKRIVLYLHPELIAHSQQYIFHCSEWQNKRSKDLPILMAIGVNND